MRIKLIIFKNFWIQLRQESIIDWVIDLIKCDSLEKIKPKNIQNFEFEMMLKNFNFTAYGENNFFNYYDKKKFDKFFSNEN